MTHEVWREMLQKVGLKLKNPKSNNKLGDCSLFCENCVKWDIIIENRVENTD